MDIEEVKVKYDQLNEELKDVLSHMELSDQIPVIREEIKKLQSLCPHGDFDHNFASYEECPYCGKKFLG